MYDLRKELERRKNICGIGMIIVHKDEMLKRWFLMKFASVMGDFDEKAFSQLLFTYSNVPEGYREFFMELLDKHYSLEDRNDKELFEMCKAIGLFKHDLLTNK